MRSRVVQCVWWKRAKPMTTTMRWSSSLLAADANEVVDLSNKCPNRRGSHPSRSFPLTAGTFQSLSSLTSSKEDAKNGGSRDSSGSKVQILEHGQALSIQWHNGVDGGSSNKPQIIAAPWLWVQDPAFIHATSGQRLRTLGQYSPEKHGILKASLVGADELSAKTLHPRPPLGSYHSRGGVYSDNDKEKNAKDRLLLWVTWTDGQESYFDADWLSEFMPFAPKTTTSTSKVTPDIAIGATHNSKATLIPTLDYRHVMTSDQGQWEALQGIVQHGAILIQHSPIRIDAEGQESDQVVADMGKRLSGGRLSHGSLYGDTFRVINQPNAHNIAYTAVALPPHQDLTYYESKPFLQLLHCVSNAAVGGASILIDAMAAAEYLRTVAPDLFEILCRVEAIFVKQRHGADMVSFKPHIVTSTYNQEVIEINWSPPFEGPPVVGESLKDMEDYMRAYQAMECLLDNNQLESSPSPSSSSSLLDPKLRAQLHSYAHNYTWEYILHPGDMLVFNNQRMCHGRRAFCIHDNDSTRGDQEAVITTSKRPRHLIGCYTDAMETINEYRLLQRANLLVGEHVPERGQADNIRNLGNGTRAS